MFVELVVSGHWAFSRRNEALCGVGPIGAGQHGSKIPLWNTASAPHIIPLTPGKLTWETGEAVYACQAFTRFWAHAHAYMDVHAHAAIMFLPFSHRAML